MLLRRIGLDMWGDYFTNLSVDMQRVNSNGVNVETGK